jgi:hypothetical protein
LPSLLLLHVASTQNKSFASRLIDKKNDRIPSCISPTKSGIKVLSRYVASLDPAIERMTEEYFFDFLRGDVMFPRELVNNMRQPNDIINTHYNSQSLWLPVKIPSKLLGAAFQRLRQPSACLTDLICANIKRNLFPKPFQLNDTLGLSPLIRPPKLALNFSNLCPRKRLPLGHVLGWPPFSMPLAIGDRL